MRHERRAKSSDSQRLGGSSTRSAATTPLAAIDRNARIALVHDWCPNFRGGERVLARLCKIFPRAEVFTLFDFLPKDVKEDYFRDVMFHVSPMNRLPFVKKYYRSLFFLCPFMVEQFDVTGYDAVISSSAAFSRGVLTRPDQPHLCYVHSPVRYAWDEQFSYLQQGGLGFGPKGLAFRYLLHNLRMWDVRTAHGPDLMLANSTYVRSRIQRIYGRDARVVHPPVAIQELEFVADKDDYYVTAAFHAPYKRTDLIIEAFSKMPSRRLVVVGDDVQSKHLRSIAGPNIVFTGYLPRHDYIDKIARARAMVFAGCEDFGIALAEAQACGTPLIAFGRGGARDIVRPLGDSNHPTGVLFDKQTLGSLSTAIERFEANTTSIAPNACRLNAARFSEERFDLAICDALGLAQSVQSAREMGHNAYLGAESTARDISDSLAEATLP
ncbi:glycosyltransferase [Mesorhizobium opportunistum]|uniref:Glycosyl transferase group 1 n=1 Tax=Mesorhizobium opportunistum (strain LMG 24607 / HAMBI 3007 / WSM2075) TaxID=536019 RepID=F7Y6U6_MESOW|nr:glycosyltransferase [Mesorhizobium opportunistum]AEH87416.1 glycosyl transferase group 1 [Mesorhizobium opportunistum WSM2075]